METAVKRLYEGMFLVDSAFAAQDWQKVLDELQRILGRAEAEVVTQKKWDERRLCYDIEGKSRGTYILIYFNCDPEKVKGIERDVQLSELIVRTLILRTDRMTTGDIEKPTPLESVAVDEAPPAAVEKTGDETPPSTAEKSGDEAESTEQQTDSTDESDVSEKATDDTIENA